MLSVAGRLIGLIAVLSYSEPWVESTSLSPAEVENAPEFNELPPRVGLTLEQIRRAHGYHPGCLRYRYPTQLVLQAYFVIQNYVGCVVAWIGDTQTSALVSATSFDVYKLFVKRTNPVVTVVNWHALGEETFEGIVPVDFDDQALNRFTMVLDRSGYPIIAWVHLVYHINRDYLRVRRWDGQSWVDMGGVLNLDGRESANKPLLEWDEDDHLFVSWSELGRHRAQWDGERWVLQ